MATKTSLREVRRRAAAKERERCIEAVPATWLDPLLTGPERVVGEPPWGCPDIERLLAAIKARIAAGK